jgi:hypothetical protein
MIDGLLFFTAECDWARVKSKEDLIAVFHLIVVFYCALFSRQEAQTRLPGISGLNVCARKEAQIRVFD